MTVAPDTDGVRVRPVERADLLAIHRIERAAFPTPWPLEAFERFVDAPGFLVAVEADGAVTGSAEGDAATERGGTRVEAVEAIGQRTTESQNGERADENASGARADETAGGTIDDDGVVGYVVAEVTPNHGRAFGHVKDLAVHPDNRRRGIASTLLERAIVTVAGHGAASVKLEVREDNEPARALYRDFGFSPMRRREGYYEDGEDALVLAREL